VKLLFDQNLSHKLVSEVSDLFPGTDHVRNIGMKTASDAAIRKYATEHGFTVVTKDTDFHQHSFVFGTPPKVIWIRLGNCPTRMVAELIRLHKAKIEEFAKNDDWVFLELR